MSWQVKFEKATKGTHPEKRPRRGTTAHTETGKPVLRRATVATQHVATPKAKTGRRTAATKPVSIEEIEPLEEERIYSVPLRQIQPDPEQHRKKFDQEALEGLAQSMRESGQKTAIVLRPIEGPRGVKYQIVAGERRYRACKLLESRGQAPRGQKPGTIRAVIRPGTDETEILTEQVIENIQRAEVTPMEEATAYRQLFDLWKRRARRRAKWAKADLSDPVVLARFEGEGRRWVAQQTGKSGQHIAFYLRLTELPAEVQAMIQRGSLSPKHAYELTRLTDGVTDPETLRERQQHQQRMARHAVAHGLSMPILRRMVTEYIAANAQGRLFGEEEIEPEELVQARAEQRAKLERLIDALVDVIDEAWSEKDQEFEPRFLVTSDIQRRIQQLEGAVGSLQQIIEAMQNELVRREVGEAVKRRRRVAEGAEKPSAEGYEVGQTLFGELTKSMGNVAFGVHKFLRVLPSRIVKGVTPWVVFDGGTKTSVMPIRKAKEGKGSAVAPPARGGRYSKEEIEALGLRWVTVHPGGYEREGVPILVRDLGDEYVVVGGAGHRMDLMRLPKREAGQKVPKSKPARTELSPEVRQELESKLEEHRQLVQAAREKVRKRVREALAEVGITDEIPPSLLDFVGERARKKAEKEGDVEHADELAEAAQKQAEKEHRERLERALDQTVDTAMQQVAEAELTGEPQVGEVEVEVPEIDEQEQIVRRLRRIRIDQDTAVDIAKQVFALRDTERAQRAVARALQQGRPPRAELVNLLTTPLTDEEVKQRALEEHLDHERVRLNNALIDMAIGGKRQRFQDRRLIDGAGDAAFAVCSELVDSIPFTQQQLQRIGTRAGARLIARHLERLGVDRDAAAKAIQDYVGERGSAVVAEAVKQGQHLLDTADRVVACAVNGGMSSACFARARALHYRNAAREVANRAIGSMAMLSQIAAELQVPSAEEFVLPGQETHTGTVMLARRMGLTNDQFTVQKTRGGYEIHVTPEGEELLMRPQTLQSYENDKVVTDIRQRRMGEGWVGTGEDGEERPWKPEGTTETLPNGAKWQLAPHQQADIKMLEHCGGILVADEAGTGKTFAAVGAIAHLISQGKVRRVLIAVEKSGVQQFYDQTQALLAPELAAAVTIATGDTPPKQRRSTLAGEGIDEDAIHIVITNHDTIRGHAGYIDEGQYDMLVLDEAHKFSLRAGRAEAQRAQALRELDFKFKMLMTGTPIENDLSEFHSLVDYVQPGLLGDREEFMARYGKLAGAATAGREALMRRLQNEVRGCLIGLRLSHPVGEGVFELRPLSNSQMPVMMREQYVRVTPTKEQRGRLREVTTEFEGRSGLPGATFSRRDKEKKVINDEDPEVNAKMQAVRNILARHPRERALIFATNDYCLRAVQESLGLSDDEIATINGGMSSKARREVQDQLNDPTSPVRVVLCTDAAATTLDMQAATVVVNVDLPDTPATVRQRIARGWRTRPQSFLERWPKIPDTVHVYHLQSETQYDIEQRERLEQKTQEMDMPYKLDITDETEGLGGILSAYLREREERAQPAA